MPLKEDMFIVIWGKSLDTDCDKSGVEMMNLEPETLRQWTKVSSVPSDVSPSVTLKARISHTAQVCINEGSNSSKLGECVDRHHHLWRVGCKDTNKIPGLDIPSMEKDSESIHNYASCQQFKRHSLFNWRREQKGCTYAPSADCTSRSFVQTRVPPRSHGHLCQLPAPAPCIL